MVDQTTDQNRNTLRDDERTKQLTIAGYTAGVTAFFAVGALVLQPTWPVAAGVAALSAMVAVVCYFIAKK